MKSIREAHMYLLHQPPVEPELFNTDPERYMRLARRRYRHNRRADLIMHWVLNVQRMSLRIRRLAAALHNRPLSAR